jgi:hypothetical protein
LIPTIFLMTVPIVVEMLAAAGVAVALFGFPFKWGLVLGMGLTDMSKAVAVPCAIDLTAKRLSTEQGIPSVILFSGPTNGVISLVLFYIILRSIPEMDDNKESEALSAAHGPLEVHHGRTKKRKRKVR